MPFAHLLDQAVQVTTSRPFRCLIFPAATGKGALANFWSGVTLAQNSPSVLFILNCDRDRRPPAEGREVSGHAADKAFRQGQILPLVVRAPGNPP